MSKVTYKSLFTLINNLVDDKIRYSVSKKYRNQLERDSVKPQTMVSSFQGNIGANSTDYTSIQTVLEDLLPGNIKSGLNVTATEGYNQRVTISAGKGSQGGYIYEIESDLDIDIPFDGTTRVFYLNLYQNNIWIDKAIDKKKLTISKIVVPEPSLSNIKIIDHHEEGNAEDAYIVNFRDVHLYEDINGYFEEDSIEKLRNNIGKILGNTIIGSITLNEDLTITNTQGTLSIDSNSLNIYDIDNNQLSKFNGYGIYFYDTEGHELTRFTKDDAKIGNILIKYNSLESVNYIEGSKGFRIKADGEAEFSDVTVRGTIEAESGSIGGFTIESDKLYGGTIQTSEYVSSGDSGVVMDSLGLRGYSSALGLIFNIPTDGSAPTFSSGEINYSTFNVNTNAVIRTSSTVGDGTINSEGVLINSLGIFGCGQNQTTSNANFRLSSLTGNLVATNAYLTNAYVEGEVRASSGLIGNVTISTSGLDGGTIEGTLIRGGVIETSATTPKVRIDDTGFYYQISATAGKYSTFKYGDGTSYGSGVLAVMFRDNYPIFSVLSEQTEADICLYNRSSDPSGSSPNSECGIIAVTGNDSLPVPKFCRSLSSGNIPDYYSFLLDAEVSGFDSGIGYYFTANVEGTNRKIYYDLDNYPYGDDSIVSRLDTLESKDTVTVIPNYIQGLIVNYVDDNTIQVEIGYCDIDGIIYELSLNTSVDTDTSGNYIEGSAVTSAYAYIYVYNNSGNLGVKLSSNDPDYSNTDDDTDGIKIYYKSESVYYRCIGAIHLDASSKIDRKFYQDGNYIQYSSFITVSISSTADANIPTISTLGYFELSALTSSSYSGEAKLRKAGTSDDYFIADEAQNSATNSYCYAKCSTNSSQQVEAVYISLRGEVKTIGYWMNIR